MKLKQCKRCNLTYLPVNLKWRKKGYCTKDCMNGGLTPMQKEDKKKGLYFGAIDLSWI